MVLKANSVRGVKELSNTRQKHLDESAMMHYECSDGDYSCKWRKVRLLRLIPEVRLELLRQREGRQTSTCTLSTVTQVVKPADCLLWQAHREEFFFQHWVIYSVEDLGRSINNAAPGCLLSTAWMMSGSSMVSTVACPETRLILIRKIVCGLKVL